MENVKRKHLIRRKLGIIGLFFLLLPWGVVYAICPGDLYVAWLLFAITNWGECFHIIFFDHPIMLSLVLFPLIMISIESFLSIRSSV